MKPPFTSWEQRKSDRDYRDRSTQLRDFSRAQLGTEQFLVSSNRVNPGPRRNRRALTASATPQVPHVLGQNSLWGASAWSELFLPSTQASPLLITGDLREAIEPYEIPGATYYPYEEVGGAAYVPKTIAL